MKKTIRLTESELITVIKKMMIENKSLMRDIGLAAVTLAIPILYLASTNEVEVVDRGGETRTPKNGEIFNGKIIKIKPYGTLNAYNNPTGYDVVVKTKNDETIKFRIDYSEKNENLKKGDTIKMKYNDNFYFWDPSMSID